MKRVLFVYGYGGSPESNSRRILRELLPNDKYEVFCPVYPQHDCAQAVEALTQVVRNECIDIVVGTSLGAFIALCLPVDKPKIAINPCMRPTVELPLLRPLPWQTEADMPSPELLATYAPFEQQLFASSHRGEDITGVFSEEDELLGTKYVECFDEQFGTVNLVPGGHHGNHAAVTKVAELITARE